MDDLELVRSVRLTTRDRNVIELCDRFMALLGRKAEQKAKSDFDRKTYMREYMRRKRAAKPQPKVSNPFEEG